MTTTLANCNLFLAGHRVLNQDVVLDGATIVYVGDAGSAGETDARFDLSGRWLAPGLLDLQINGAGGALFQAAPNETTLSIMESTLRSLGITGFLPTLTPTTVEITFAAAEAVGKYLSHGPRAVLGLNLEGPFINPSKAGMSNANECCPYDSELVRGVVERVAPGKVYMTLAPENVGTQNFETRDVVFAIGHTTATYDQAQAFFSRGVGAATHIFNAMTGIGGRDPGVAGAVLDSKTIRSSLIADGYHVHPAIARLVYAHLGSDRLYLVSDGMPPLGSEVRQFTYGDNTVTEENGRCTTADGVLAGTAVSIAQAANKFASWLDADIAEILPLVTSTPAKLLGIDNQYGEIRAGGIANLVLADSLLNIEHTIVQGDLSALR